MPPDLQEHPDRAPDRGASAGASGGPGTGAVTLPQYDDAGRPLGPDLTAGGAASSPGDEAAGSATGGRFVAGPVERARLRLVREVAVVAGAAPDEALRAWTDALDPETAPIEIVVEAVAAAVRLESAARARTIALAAALARRPEMEPAWGRASGPVPQHRSVAADELAMRLGTSRAAANRLVHEGQVLDLGLPATAEALASGHLDTAKASLLVRRLGDLPAEVTEPVEDLVLPRAAERSLAQLRVDVDRALAQIDPDGAAARHELARETRTLTRPRPEADGMASMWLVLAAEDAAAVDGVLEHAARTARVGGDRRTLAQLRADGLRDLVVGDVPAALRVGGEAVGGDTSSDDSDRAPRSRAVGPCRCGGAARAGAQIRVTVPASTLLGLDDQPADLEGHGPIDAVTARALAAGGTWQRIVTDPRSGTVLDVGRTRYRPPAALDEHVRARDRHCAAPGCTVPATRADVDHTREYHLRNTRPRRGADARPHDAGGGTDARDRRALPGNRATSDALGTLDNGQRTTAPDALGTTAAHNLGVLCRRHHRLKTDGGFRLRQIAPGLYLWITPGGHVYLTRPGTDQAVDITSRTAPVEPDDPPF